MGLMISKGGQSKKAPYPQSSVRCPEPATPQTRTILNMYRELYQNKSSSDADNFLNQIEMFALELYASGVSSGVTDSDDNTTGGKIAETVGTKEIQAIADKIRNEEPGFKRNSASALCRAVIEISESITQFNVSNHESID
jgi:hypothetical protein